MAVRTPRVLVLRAAGINCDCETERAFEMAGADAERVHINRIIEVPSRLHECHILVIPGGFSYGDDVASGRILANELRGKLGEELRRFVDDGKLILGICNGFQVLVKSGLLPGHANGSQTVTLTLNDSNKFEDRWVYLKATSAGCVFVREGEDAYLPVAHAEGKFIVDSPAHLAALEEAGQVVFRYVGPDGDLAAYPWNPNGSQGNVAGVCDPTGRIFGLMPHPERHVEPTQHPRWTREGLKPAPDGIRVFRNAVAYVQKELQGPS